MTRPEKRCPADSTSYVRTCSLLLAHAPVCALRPSQRPETRYELTEEERQSKRSPEELRGDLMAKIKRDNTEVEQMTAQVRTSRMWGRTRVDTGCWRAHECE